MTFYTNLKTAQDLADEATAEELEVEKVWVQEELAVANEAIFAFEDSYTPAPAGTISDWRTYRNNLRNHVLADVVQGARPTRPT